MQCSSERNNFHFIVPGVVPLIFPQNLQDSIHNMNTLSCLLSGEWMFQMSPLKPRLLTSETKGVREAAHPPPLLWPGWGSQYCKHCDRVICYKPSVTRFNCFLWREPHVMRVESFCRFTGLNNSNSKWLLLNRENWTRSSSLSHSLLGARDGFG